MSFHTSIADDEIQAPIVDYSVDYPQMTGRVRGYPTYGELKTGTSTFEGKEIQTVPLSSRIRAQEIAATLKQWIEKGTFTLTEPQVLLPSK